jgi:hypothetical protein
MIGEKGAAMLQEMPQPETRNSCFTHRWPGEASEGADCLWALPPHPPSLRRGSPLP